MFKVKNLKKIQKILNIQVIHNCKMRTLHLNQIHYINKILKNFHMQSDKHRVISILFNKYNVFCSVDLTDQRIN